MASIDSRQIAALFQTHGPVVLRRADRILGNRADAEEATQEIFLRVVRSARAFNAESALTTWLYQISTNYCLNVLRDRRRRDALDRERPPSGSTDSTSVEAGADELILLRQVLGSADPREAEAAVYVLLDGMSHEEVAGVLDVSRRTVGNLVERFLDRARKQTELPIPGGTK